MGKPDTTTQAADDQHKVIGANAVPQGEFQRTTHPDAQWFPEAGLGLFIHWGISSVHGGIDLSWGMMKGKPWDPLDRSISPEEYYRLAERFNPTLYDPDKWLRAAKEAGFRYAVLTTKHHDGYTLWPSAYGEIGVGKYLPGVDLVGRYIEACRKHDLKVGLYYSPPDWYFNRHYISFHFGSGDQQRFPDRQHFDMRHQPIDEIPHPPAGFQQDYEAYIHGQVVELLTRYGQIDLLWFDGGPEAISIEEIRALQPGIVINPRMHKQGDFKTPECRMPDGPLDGWWELCDIWPFGSWGYDRNHEEYKSLGWMLSRLTRVRGWGGNYLINVGPRPTGEMPDVYYLRLSELGAWMQHSGESVFGVQPGPHPEQSNVPVTVRGNRWYLHCSPGFETPIVLKGVAAPRSVVLLRTGDVLKADYGRDIASIIVPPELRTRDVDVVAVDW